jgi:cytochrome P450
METYSYLLVRHPAVLERLRQDIESVVQNGQDLARAHIHKMSYLRYVLNESQEPISANVLFAR